MAAQEKFDLVIRARDEATATLGRINGEVNRLASGSVPNVARAADGMSAAFSRAELKSAVLGSRLAGMSPILGQVSNAFMFGNPLIAAAALGIGLLSSAVVDMITAHSQAEKAIRSHTVSLIELSESTNKYAKSAAAVLEVDAALIQKEKGLAQGQIAMAQAGLRTTTFLERLVGLGYLVKASVDDQNKAVAQASGKLSELKKEEDLIAKANLAAAFKATIGPMTSVDEVTQSITEHTRQLNEQWQQTKMLMTGGGVFGGLGDTAAIGLSTVEGQAQIEADRLKDAFAQAGTGPQSWLVEHDMFVDQVKKQQDELAGYIEASAGRAMAGIVEVFTEGRINLANIFKGMAQDFIQFFVQQIAKAVGFKIAGAILGAAIAGPAGGAIGGAAGGAAGGSAVGDFTVDPGIFTKRSVPTGAVAASAQPIIIVTAPLSMTQDFVRKHVMPEIRRLQMVGGA